MRFVIQIVDNAHVDVEGATVGRIDKGYLVLAGMCEGDTRSVADKMVAKLLNLRIFKDETDRINLSVKDVGGQILLVSQFTLYADTRKGNRPNFISCMAPDEANELFEYVVERVRSEVEVVETGVFGAHMSVGLVNDGPFTVILDSADLKI
ncbi:D-tyrosyl-tRNA(Tyr) deacylase [Ruminococcaceae bacterium YRB3002]|nr:D-tyrosyl-tRNA(Tyr) deacylase [Ruminococcaceae bacterium YRB3002]